MADLKISALTASTTPLAGTEVLPIVQSSTTKQVSVANLTAGRAVSALSATLSSLTSGRVPYATTSGLLTDSANLQFDGTNLGVGVTPNAWTTLKPIQFSGGASLAGFSNTGFLGANCYFNGSWRYISTATSGRYEVGDSHKWFSAPSGTAGDVITFTQALTLDASGNMQLGTTSQLQSSRLSVSGSGNVGDFRTSSAGGYPVVCENTAAGSTSMVIFLSGPSTTTVGSITYNGALTVYATTSDHRLKNVIGAVTGSGERLDALEPIEYEFKENGLRTRGFLAHKFQEVYAGSVTGTKDAVDEQGNPVYQQMQASSSEVIADLVAEIQSLRKRLADAGI